MLDDIIRRIKQAEVRSLPLSADGKERIDVVSIGLDLKERDFVIACLEQCGSADD